MTKADIALALDPERRRGEWWLIYDPAHNMQAVCGSLMRAVMAETKEYTEIRRGGKTLRACFIGPNLHSREKAWILEEALEARGYAFLRFAGLTYVWKPGGGIGSLIDSLFYATKNTDHNAALIAAIARLVEEE